MNHRACRCWGDGLASEGREEASDGDVARGTGDSRTKGNERGCHASWREELVAMVELLAQSEGL